MKLALAAAMGAWAAVAAAAGDAIPLPDAPVRLVIPDAAAFDAVLTGTFREALGAELRETEPVLRGFRQSRVGAKLEDQWGRLRDDIELSWPAIMKLQPRAIGLALLQVGNLEAVLVIETPLADLPLPLPEGTAKAAAGIPFQVVTAGAADGDEGSDRRMGLAYAKTNGRLFLSTSERALRLALEAMVEGKGMTPALDGLVTIELDLDLLAEDRYFRREFLFSGEMERPEPRGLVRAALRREDGRLVEVREGSGPALPAVPRFDSAGAAAAGWEQGSERLVRALRAGLMEPVRQLSDKPVPGVAPLPPAASKDVDTYLIDFRKHAPSGAANDEEGDVGAWKALMAKVAVPGWGYRVSPSDERLIVFPWPPAHDRDLEILLRATIERRAGRSRLVTIDSTRELQIGPGLPALAWRRAGAYVWLGPSADALAALPRIEPTTDVERWAMIDLDAVRAFAPKWQALEQETWDAGEVPVLSGRLLGFLDWMPSVRALEVERRRSGAGWREKVVLAPRP